MREIFELVVCCVVGFFAMIFAMASAVGCWLFAILLGALPWVVGAAGITWIVVSVLRAMGVM